MDDISGLTPWKYLTNEMLVVALADFPAVGWEHYGWSKAAIAAFNACGPDPHPRSRTDYLSICSTPREILLICTDSAFCPSRYYD